MTASSESVTAKDNLRSEHKTVVNRIEVSVLETRLLALNTLIEAAAAGEVAKTGDMEDIFSLLNDPPQSAILHAEEVARRAIVFIGRGAK